MPAVEPVSPRLAAKVEDAARRLGLPLTTIELMTEDARVARAFLEANARGQGRAFVEDLDVDHLDAALRARRRRVLEEAPEGLLPFY